MNLFTLGVMGFSLLGFFAASPSSTNYQLKAYDFGSGGGSGSSTNYKSDTISGTAGGNGSSTNYKSQGGETSTQNANTPSAPTLTNPSSYYNRLKLVLSTSNNPTDTKYLIAISSDNFVTTKYVQTDNSIGLSYTIANYQTYASWGGASGFLILGLSPNTGYSVKVKAIQGVFSESSYSPTATASTAQTSLSFGLTTSLSSTPPYSIGFSSLAAGTVYSADADAIVAFDSNSVIGGDVYIKSKNAGLVSSSASFTISSATANLSVAASGYGAQVTSTGQTSGGPVSSVSPFNLGSNNVGNLTTSLQTIVTSPASMVGGTATIRIKAKTDSTTPAANDYTDTLTFVAAMSF